MTKTEIESRIISLVERHTYRNVKVDIDSSFIDLNFDSLDSVELLIECELEFNIQINDEDWAQVYNVKDIVNIISNTKNIKNIN